MNLCITISNYSQALKTALITPIVRVSDPRLISDYRSITILCMLSNDFEKLFSTQINSFLKFHEHLLDPFPCGNKKNHNTITALLNLSTNEVEEMGNCNFVCSVLLAFKQVEVFL